MPAPRTFDNTPLVPVTPPPDELAWGPPAAQARITAVHLEGFVQLAAPVRRKPGARTKPAPLAPDFAEETSGTLRKFLWQDGRVYTVQTSPSEVTHLVLPDGESLAMPPAVDLERWPMASGLQKTDEHRYEIYGVRPVAPNQRTRIGLFLKRGGRAYVELVSREAPGVLEASWMMPRLSLTTPPPSASRLPVIDATRLRTSYRVEVLSKHTPPWATGLTVVDDGRNVFIKFAESLRYTAAPVPQGIEPDGSKALVEPLLYTHPTNPDAGTVLLVKRLWPALELLDSSKGKVRLTLQAS
jgi:hypothetical protein